jgi:DNA-binding Xre family transcriptional regulator
MKWTIREVAEAKGIRTARELGEKAGIPPTSIYRLWNGTAKMVGTDTLERLCTFLDVPVGMLIQHIPEKDRIIPQEPTQLAQSRRSGPAQKSKRESNVRTANVALVGA